MPSFPLQGLSIDHVRSHPVFDARTEPSRMGAISETFRLMPGVLRSVHPTHPVCAQGPAAAELVAGHERADNPLGPGTPFERLLRIGAKNLLLGTSVRPLTAYHMFESLREPPFPYRVFWPERLPVRVIDMDGREADITTLVHEPSLAPGRIDFQPWVEKRMRERLDEDGMTAIRVGRGEILCQTLPAMFATFERMLERDETIYHPDVLKGLRLT
jgi:aminoglycoside 3-N-acetyltransferase